MNDIVIPYATRWGRQRSRTLKGHPKRVARKARAYARGGSMPGTKPNPHPSAMKAQRQSDAGNPRRR